MKIQFDNKTFIEMVKSNINSNIFYITIASKDANGKSMIINSVELTEEQVKHLFSDVKLV